MDGESHGMHGLTRGSVEVAGDAEARQRIEPSRMGHILSGAMRKHRDAVLPKPLRLLQLRRKGDYD